MASRIKGFGLFLVRYLFVLWLAISLLFLCLVMVRGNPVDLYLDPRLTQELKQQLKVKYGYDAPTHIRYIRYLKSLSEGDLGVSFKHRKPVGV
ncbi:MAG: hypothetical protein MI867_14430, partial [Pseudomonadales bacterium]|nr:hypothetical protein [Pseudomonadales bacterium]